MDGRKARKLTAEGKIVVGMTKDEVESAWGKPDRIAQEESALIHTHNFTDSAQAGPGRAGRPRPRQ